MKVNSVKRRVLSSALAVITVLMTSISALSLGASAATVANPALSEDKIIGGSDFSELEATESVGGSRGNTPIENSDGKIYLRFDHGNAEKYNIISENGEVYAVLNYASSSGVGIYVPFIKTAGNAFTVNVRARYEHDASGELELITLCGKSSGELLNLVKLGSDGSIMYCEGSSYKDLGIDLTEFLWKDIAVSLEMKSGKLYADYYVNGVLRVKDKAVNSSFTSFSGFKAFNVASGTVKAVVEVDDVFAYNSDTPLYGTVPTASSDSINAVLDIESLEAGKTFYENYRTDGMYLSPNGNPMQVLTEGANKYLTFSGGDYPSYAEMISKKANAGISQILEVSIKRDKNFATDSELLSPYYEDASGIVQRIALLTLKDNGNIILTKTGELVGGVSTERYTVVSAVLSFDREYVDIYVDGVLSVAGVEYTDKEYSEIDGVRVVRMSERATGSLYIDYAVMYSGIAPSCVTDGTTLCYENGFNSADVSNVKPLVLNGSALGSVKFGKSTGIGYTSSGAGSASLALESSELPLYTEFEFMYTKLGSDAKPIVFKRGDGSEYTALGIESNGTLYSYSDGKKLTARKLVSGKAYQVIAVVDPENSICSVYIDGEVVFAYGFVDGVESFDTLSLIQSGGNSTMSIDNLRVYRSYSKLGEPLSGQTLDFELSTGWDGDVVIKWDDVGYGAKYTVWKSVTAGSEQVKISDIVSGDTFSDTDVEENKTYYYSVYQTVIRAGEEIYVGLGTNIKPVTVTLPREADKPASPSGELPSFKSVLEYEDDFSDDKTSLELITERCFIEKSSSTLRIINESDSKDIPYFAYNEKYIKKAAIYDLDFNISKCVGKVVLAGVYGEKGKVGTIATVQNEKLYVGDDDEYVMNLQNGVDYRLTVWVDIGCDRAAVFINGAYVAAVSGIPAFYGRENGYIVRFCQAMDETVMTVDNFKAINTRSFITDYEKYVSIIATASGETNNISWNDISGVKNYTLWASSNESDGFIEIASELTGFTYSEADVKNTRYYGITYTFEQLGVELTTPMSDVGICYRNASSSSTQAEVPPFIDLSDPSEIMITVIFAVGFAGIVAAFITSKKSSVRKD